MKIRILLGVAILLAAGLSATAAAPPDLGALSGTVVGVDMTTPLAGAVIRVVNVADGREYLSQPSGPNGQFDLSGIANGRYVVTVIAGGTSFSLKDRLYVKGRETGELNLGIGRDKDRSDGMAEEIVGVQMGQVTQDCIWRPKPPKPPKSHHQHHHHGPCD
jgi:hypothetical protein